MNPVLLLILQNSIRPSESLHLVTPAALLWHCLFHPSLSRHLKIPRAFSGVQVTLVLPQLRYWLADVLETRSAIVVEYFIFKVMRVF